MRTYCTAQGTLLRALWWPKWKGNPKKRDRCICIGKGNSLQYSCLKNPMDRGALQSMGSQRVGHDWVSMYMYSWFTLCTGETNTILYSNYTPTEINLKKKTRSDPTRRAHSLIILEKAKFPTWKALPRYQWVKERHSRLASYLSPALCFLLPLYDVASALNPSLGCPGCLSPPVANHPNFWSWERFSQLIILSYFSN